MKKILQARGITKRWPGVLALDNVDFNIYEGGVNVLVGENGAGKSTLMNIISGVYPDYEGTLTLDGAEVRFRSTAEAFEAGIAMVHQELNLIPQLSIAENIFLGREPQNRLGLIDYKRMHREAKELLEQLDFHIDTHTKVAQLKVGQQQMVEIAKALSHNAKVFILDEPTSSLSDNETKQLFRLIHELTDKGVGIVYISHKMDELQLLADYVTVLRDGKLISEEPAEGLSTDDIVRMMVGRKSKDFFVRSDRQAGDICLSVKNLTLRQATSDTKTLSDKKLDDVSFSVRRGEVLGIYGLMGAGRTEIFECLFGLHPDDASGTIQINGESAPDSNAKGKGTSAPLPKSPREAIAAGIALIPEDRKTDGLVLNMDIAQNTTLPSLSQLFKWQISEEKETAIADEYRTKLATKSHSSQQKAGELSGGNQQKVVLAKWLLTQPQVLLLDEPTRGIDIGAKNEIYKLIDSLASEGKAVIVVSSELPEIMAISDRLLTLCEGRLTAEFLPEQFNQETILEASLPK